MNRIPQPPTKEMLDRLRRIETRLTRYMEAQGFDTEVRRPEWLDGFMELPTDATSLRDCLAAIPEAWQGTVTLTVKGRTVAILQRDSSHA